MAYSRPKTVAIFSDNRGINLQNAIQAINNTTFNIGVQVIEEATLNQLGTAACLHLDMHKQDVIYIMGGIYNIIKMTQIPNYGKTFTFDWQTSEELVAWMDNYLLDEIGKIKYRYPAAKVAVCTMTGI